MEDADAEAAFLNSMKAMNEEGAETYEVYGTDSGQQIDSSSDEYDPAQDVQDISVSSGSLAQSDQVASAGTLSNDVQLPNSANPPLPNALRSKVSGLATIPVSNTTTTSTNQGHADVQGLIPKTPDQTSDSRHPRADPPAGGQEIPNGYIAAGESDVLENESDRLKPVDREALATTSEPGVSTDTDNRSMQNVAAGNAPLLDTENTSDNANPNATANISQAMPSTRDDGDTKSAEPRGLDVETISLPKPRLPHDKIGLLEDRIKEDEKGDMDAWLSLIGEYRKRGKLEEARKVYGRFFAMFTSAAEQWVAFIEMENDAQNRAAVDVIFQNTLLKIPNLQLWSAYLDHIRRHHNVTTDTSGAARQTIQHAYDVALKNIGIDRESGKVWQDYIEFVKSGPGNIGDSNWQAQQKMDWLRKAYQGAICVPTQMVENIWREYNAFEMGLNKVTGRKFLQDQSPAYMSARSSFIELQKITRGLKRTTLPVLPPAPGFDGDTEYMTQVDLWKRWIQWEKDDPLVLKQDDIEAYRKRITFVYKQALMALRFWPQLWFDAAEFCFDNHLETDGNDFLTQGIAANPESCLLAFKYADRLELTSTNEEGDEAARRRGTAVREPYDKVLDALYDLIAKTALREAMDIARIEAEFSEAGRATDSNGSRISDVAAAYDDREPEGDSASGTAEQRKETQKEAVKNVHAGQIRLIQRTLSHAWIALMRAMRRIQGKGKVGATVGGLRQVLTDARKRGRITSDVWLAAAMLEFHMTETEASKRIFERGIKLFPEDESFAVEYIKHLIANNDHTNARVVFETSVGRLAQKPENVPKTKPLYILFHNFESRYGELNQIAKLEKRMRDLFPDDPKLTSFAQRFTSDGIDPTSAHLIISPATQARPKPIPSIETPPPAAATNSPLIRNIQSTDSPKRPAPIEESDNDAASGRPRKLARGESPLKGAAGRRVDQQKRNRQPHEGGPQYDGGHTGSSYALPPLPPPPPPPPALPRDVLFLLSIIPRASTYHATRFKAEEMVRLIRDTPIPNSVKQLRQPGPPPSMQSMIQQQQQQQQLGQGQYGGQYYR